MKAVAYYRTSSASRIVEGKDNLPRQREAVTSYANRANLELLEEFYDAAVSGADPIQERPGFAALLDRIEGNGVRIVLVEDASRFARDLITQDRSQAEPASCGREALRAGLQDLEWQSAFFSSLLD